MDAERRKFGSASVNGIIGHVGVELGFLGALAGVGTLGVGLVTRRPQLLAHARTYAYIVLFGALVATAALERALVTHDFRLAFVAANNSRETPLLFSITGMWSALQGSILLWSVILAGYLAFAAHHFRRRASDPLVGWALLIAFVVAAFFFALMIGPSDPFAATRGAIPADGTGPNPLLQDNLLILVHPVFLYLGLVGFTIPFAFAIASLLTGRVGEEWLLDTRRLTLVAWGFLTIGIALGAWWSYEELGWGGFWGWDPVENVALLPWLTATAYLHSVLVQSRRGLLRIWNLSLLIATFSLTILGTFLDRSGVVESVHAFSDSGIGPALLGFFAAVVVVGLGLIFWRGDRLRSPGTIDSPVSREGAFLVNNLLFAAFAAVVLLGTVFPLFIQAIDNQSVTIGRPYFDTFTVPIGIALLFSMSVAPVLPWRKAKTSVLRERLAIPAWVAAIVVVACIAAGIRGLTPLVTFGLGAFAGAVALRQLVLATLAAHRHGLGWWRGVLGRANGGMVVHLGVVVVAVGLTAASSFGQRAEFTLRPGQTIRYDGHALTVLRWQPIHAPSETGEEVLVRVDGSKILRPGIAQFNGSLEGTAMPSIDSSLFVDVYLSPGAEFPADPGRRSPATLDVIVQPLVMWLWIGATMIAGGAVLAAFPGRRRRATDPVSLSLPELEEELPVPAGTLR